jgi:hypothetical protein
MSEDLRDKGGTIIEVKPEKRLNIAMAMPRYGLVNREADMAAMTGAFHTPGTICHIINSFSSCTPHQFNQCWTHCMNEVDKFDYFCMLHSDVEPLPTVDPYDRGKIVPWLTAMIEEMEKGSYDVIHSVAAIKDGNGLTSTGIGSGLNAWPTMRRVTLKELTALPETFDAKQYLDLFGRDRWPAGSPEVMLCNTGCMIVKVGDWCRRFHGFRFITVIVVFSEDGKKLLGSLADAKFADEWDGKGNLVPYFWPEDWDFGQWCHSRGKKVGATIRVRTNHYGSAPFSTKPGFEYGELHDPLFFTDYKE